MVSTCQDLLLAMTQPGLGADGASAAVKVQSVWDFIIKGGPMMVPIGICSFIALAVFAERLLTLRRRNVIPPQFLPGLKKRLAERDGREAALKYCQAQKSPIARVFASGLKKLDAPVEVLEKHIVEAGEREVLKMRRFLRVLQVIAAIAPLMGLLGTIFGMIRAFQTVAESAEALGKTELLAGGIYEAMITTAAGLIVAIPVLIFYHWINARIDKLVMDIDQMTVEFLEERESWMAGPAELAAKSGGKATSDGKSAATSPSVGAVTPA